MHIECSDDSYLNKVDLRQFNVGFRTGQIGAQIHRVSSNARLFDASVVFMHKIRETNSLAVKVPMLV